MSRYALDSYKLQYEKLNDNKENILDRLMKKVRDAKKKKAK